MEVAVYLFTGFLEAGKTKFINESMSDPNFNDGKRRVLILSCEEGEEEYSSFGDNITVVNFDDVTRLTPDRLSAQQKRAKADVVVVEYNGMWTLDSFYNAMPSDWMIYQEVFIADASTIMSYNQNMRQLTVDKLSSCELVVFNRCPENIDKMALHKLVRGVSRKADIYYEKPDGDVEIDDIEDPLPFDIEAPVIEIRDEDFALFYRDMSEDFAKYVGKTVRFKGIVALDKSLPASEYAIGRHIMTCCEADIAYRGVVAKGMGSLSLKTRDWVIVEGKLVNEYSKLYRAQGPVLEVKKIVRAEKPIQEVATFY
jgi:hypothetical protein